MSLYSRKVFICGSCSVLVLTSVLSRPRNADDKTGIDNYQGLPANRENVIRKYRHFVWPFCPRTSLYVFRDGNRAREVWCESGYLNFSYTFLYI